jgi:hypothetical protein
LLACRLFFWVGCRSEGGFLASVRSPGPLSNWNGGPQTAHLCSSETNPPPKPTITPPQRCGPTSCGRCRRGTTAPGWRTRNWSRWGPGGGEGVAFWDGELFCACLSWSRWVKGLLDGGFVRACLVASPPGLWGVPFTSRVFVLRFGVCYRLRGLNKL